MFYNIATKIYKDVDYPNIPIPIYAMFYVVMSQYFKNVRIKFGGEKRELRLSFFWISNSRTGKGQLYKVAEKVARGLNLTTAIETDITDAGLLGSVDDKAIDYNYKNKLKEGDKGYKEPAIHGDIFNYDIIFFRECKKLLKPGTHTEMLLSILQESLDEPGYVRKKLKSKYPIEGETTESIVATTYYMPEIEKTLAEQGFFMRVPLYHRNLSITEIKNLRNAVIAMFKNSKNLDVDKEVKDFCSAIMKIKNDEIELVLDDKAIKKITEINNKFCKIMEGTSGNKLNILKGISQTVIDLSVKIGGIHACLEGNKKILERHIIPANIFVRACIDTILNKIEISESKELQKKRGTIVVIAAFKKLLIKEKNITKEMFANELKKSGYGRNKALYQIKNLIEENYLKAKQGRGNTQYLVLNEDIL